MKPKDKTQARDWIWWIGWIVSIPFRIVMLLLTGIILNVMYIVLGLISTSAPSLWKEFKDWLEESTGAELP